MACRFAPLFATELHWQRIRELSGSAEMEECIRSWRESVTALQQQPLPRFERAWWRTARLQHWSQTYPQINRHTQFALTPTATHVFNAALLFRTTEEPEALTAALNGLAHFTKYRFFARHPDTGLNWTVWNLPLLDAASMLEDWMSNELHQALEGHFQRAARAIDRNDRWWIRNVPGGRHNNHHAFHKAFLGCWAAVTRDDALMRRVIDGPEGVRELMEQAVMDDGLWFESSLNYHFAAAAPLCWLAERLANRPGALNLWEMRFANNRRLIDLLKAPLGITFPDLTLPMVGDCYARRACLTEYPLMGMAHELDDHPDLTWLAQRHRNAQTRVFHMPPTQPADAPIMPACRYWPEHRYVRLTSTPGREYWSGHGYTAFLTLDRSGIHSHLDGLSLQAFGQGAHLLTDVEAQSDVEHAFSSTVQATLNRTTLCHNTLMVDGADHAPLAHPLELVTLVDQGDLRLATVADRNGALYAGVRMQRTVAVTSHWLLDLFQVESNDAHQYDYLLHGPEGGGSWHAPLDWMPAKLPAGNPWRWIRNARRSQWKAPVTLTAHPARVTMQADRPGTLFNLQMPAGAAPESPTRPMLMARRTGRRAWFCMLLQSETDIPGRIVRCAAEPDGIRIVVESDGSQRMELRVARLT